jgi:hypothetical protein
MWTWTLRTPLTNSADFACKLGVFKTAGLLVQYSGVPEYVWCWWSHHIYHQITVPKCQDYQASGRQEVATHSHIAIVFELTYRLITLTCKALLHVTLNNQCSWSKITPTLLSFNIGDMSWNWQITVSGTFHHERNYIPKYRVGSFNTRHQVLYKCLCSQNISTKYHFTGLHVPFVHLVPGTCVYRWSNVFPRYW